MNVDLRILSLEPLQMPHLLLPVAALLATLLSACVPPSGEPQVVKPPITDLVATLEDKVQPLSRERITWSTYWKLCWKDYPGAVAYERQAVTSEGVSPKVHRVSNNCFRLKAAGGENHKSFGLLDRDQILGMHSVELSYRVRAVLNDNRVSEWSPMMAAGKAAKPGDN
jgi:hypothetical protein